MKTNHAMREEAPYTPMEGLIEIHPVDVPRMAISLAERALALADIMEYLNKANSTNGSKTQAANKDSDFSKRYADRTAKVQKGAEKNTAELLGGFRRGIQTLAATDVMEAHGYDPADIDRANTQVQAGINREFGVGRADAHKRAAAVKRAEQYPDFEKL
jgi:hypothetical protein